MSEESPAVPSPENGFRIEYAVDKNLADSMRESIDSIFKSTCSFYQGYAEAHGLDRPVDGVYLENIPLKFDTISLDDVIVADDGVNPEEVVFGYELGTGGMFKANLMVTRLSKTEERLNKITITVPASRTDGLGEQEIVLDGFKDNPKRNSYAYEDLDTESIATEIALAASNMKDEKYWENKPQA